MQQSIRLKLDEMVKRYQTLENMQSDSEVMVDHKMYEKVAKEMHSLADIVNAYGRYQSLEVSKEEAEMMLNDPEMGDLAQQELEEATQALSEVNQELMLLLLPKDPDDDKDIYLEIRACAGGDEAALFVGDLLRMYMMYADRNKWRCEMISQSTSSAGGYKEVVYSLKGHDVYRFMKYESGTHRVQRIPQTESQGRIHTSTCTVAILPQVNEIAEVDINPSDLRIDTYRSSGAGGQHVNTTDSAVRITHIPTQTVVECQDERSQHKNKAKAMSLLSAKILQQQRMQQQAKVASQRSLQVGSGDRSERIRTYNFPQGRLTDHRIGLTLYRLSEVMEGDIDELVESLIRENKARQLSGLNDGD
ncbi:peptide chain release factor 1 [Candidatus Comchoanobacter bicostacola]|uniref:Peptide chain release factor 1 n=1 Tax=Candidatus Comchoanobacter bicostacola TaxID=2919598 RepID=A0ABY5DIM9_9GAMM|nr:peptide chain release factor 1 [Candidatus Comchoanobacter bicostacola]UTC24466.1 peptide chain release factor 1 [Candidatus Comchoanobacter bicostacola]